MINQHQHQEMKRRKAEAKAVQKAEMQVVTSIFGYRSQKNVKQDRKAK